MLPSATRQHLKMMSMRASATLTDTPCPREPHLSAQLGPVGRVKRFQFRSDRHPRSIAYNRVLIPEVAKQIPFQHVPGSGGTQRCGLMLSTMVSSSSDPVRLAEALLFQSSGPVSRTTLARALGEDVDLAQILSQVTRRTKGLGFELVAVGDGWMFRTAPDVAEARRAVLEPPRERLPRAALEVLLLIAARQPVTRPEIESFRDAALPQKTLTLLQERGLIHSVGRKPVPGQPQLWATTETFLVTYGLKSLTELDPLLEGLRGPL